MLFAHVSKIELRSKEFLNISMGILSFPFDFPADMHVMKSLNSSSVNGFVRRSFSSDVNFCRFRSERYVSILSSEQVSLFWNRDLRCEAAIEHMCL